MPSNDSPIATPTCDTTPAYVQATNSPVATPTCDTTPAYVQSTNSWSLLPNRPLGIRQHVDLDFSSHRHAPCLPTARARQTRTCPMGLSLLGTSLHALQHQNTHEQDIISPTTKTIPTSTRLALWSCCNALHCNALLLCHTAMCFATAAPQNIVTRDLSSCPSTPKQTRRRHHRAHHQHGTRPQSRLV